MGLTEKRQKFYQIRGRCQIIIRYHAYGDHPERKFTQQEIKNLIQYGSGRIVENDSPEAIEESFLYFPRDNDERECKLVVLLQEVEIEDKNESNRRETIIVCSAYREVNNET